MKRVLSYLKPYRGYMAFAWLLMLVELAVELTHPLFMAKIIDEGIVKQDMGAVYKWGAFMLGTSLLAFASGIINSFAAAHVGQNFGFDLREKMMEKVQSFSFANYSRFAASSLITRLTNDVTQLQNAVFMSLRIMLRAPLMVIFGTVMAFLIHAKLTVILLVTIPPMLIFLFMMMKRSASLFRSVQQRLDRVNNVIQENLTGMRIIKAFLRWKHEVSRFQEAGEKLMSQTIRVLRAVEATTPVLLLVMNASLIAILWFGFAEFANGTATEGQIVAVINYATRIISSLSMFTFILMAFSRGRASSQRIGELLEQPEEEADQRLKGTPFQPQEGSIEFEEVGFSFPGSSAPVLDGITFSVQPGKTAAILGATGSGKSTLFYLIPRLYELDAGKILIDGQDIRTLQPASLREQIGFVPQESHLFTGTIRENISWGKEDASMEEVIEAARRAQIHETVESLPKKYDTMIGQKGVNLSGGQKQRLSIARALIRKPLILLLDDSTSALDVQTEARLLSEIRKESCTTVIITQKISTAMQADQIILLEDGKVTASGSHEELVAGSEFYRRILASQYGKEGMSYVKVSR
ncbi:ABC transporter ATP-binding protein [Bacillus badius]|uniref:Lipid A export ATP-binding/permease protein MsbA n=1 Tax=Bacillus badius TaxID=1455 RepID=A0ABR5ARC3_BACBA|nr:ABC transporter ATP-binding protein [Bacillus badius]KIL72421.1 Lipid A export ATP-binding/permease protein MsbA [Bacillus badius]KIL77316.1 Lipid A export ATP-binding/permease protein MsbA [Bacillus badius]KZO01305.1 ABC transporter ATP-binding protein [Bacillus badius]KZR58109.1 ABC transporter ATP-binding protein [Bacillus badius]MED0665154.1 ABC transporter ATP-binding protein [Bacillus badius]